VKALNIDNKSVDTDALLRKAKEIPGAWTGLKIAILILLKEGHRPTDLNKVFGLSRQTMTRWVHQVNEEGLEALEKTPPPGRPSQLSEEVKCQIEVDLLEDPRVFGLPRGKWNAHKLQLHLQRRYGIKVKTRQARNYLNEFKLDPGKQRGTPLFAGPSSQE
jgi:transposase